MARYPRVARDAALKCISCNAPITQTVDERYVCTKCGESPVMHKSSGQEMWLTSSD